MESCVACGKADTNLKACAACMLVKYCGVNCQLAHRSEHKHACRKRAAELFDVKLFAEPPCREECPICCRILPFDDAGICYMGCCGKNICCGCRFCLPREHCPFCNTAAPRSHEEANKRVYERIAKYNDPEAMYQLGSEYSQGVNGLPLDHVKANELFQRAIELGSAGGHCRLALAYFLGKGIQVDTKKAIHHWQMAAMMGNVSARCRLGAMEALSGNHNRAMRHFMIAARCGHDESLKTVKKGYMDGDVTKDDFEKTLREHKASQDETKSDERDRAKAEIRR
eukprot:scaffold24638_cov48-Cyclotella_meneghiniana.AAC.6